MITLTDHYKIQGYYMLRGIKGDQSGDVYTCSDGKIIGTIKGDNNDGGDHPKDPKLFLGYLNKEKNLGFLKLPLGFSMLMPVIWYMNLEEERPVMRFRGNWAFAPNLPVTEQLDKLVNSEALNMDLLKQFPVEQLIDMYFIPHTIDMIKTNNLSSECTGELYFDKV